jgi:hypothetical protein
MSKVNCLECEALILETTFEKNNGKCMPCAKPVDKNIQGFFGAIFSKKVESSVNAHKILKLSFVLCVLPIVVIAVLHLFFPDIFSEAIAPDQVTIFVAYVFGLSMALLGWLIIKRKIWAAYTSIAFFIGPNIIDAIISTSIPDLGLYDMWFVIFMAASIRSIKCLQQENA